MRTLTIDDERNLVDAIARLADGYFGMYSIDRSFVLEMPAGVLSDLEEALKQRTKELGKNYEFTIQYNIRTGGYLITWELND